MTDRVGYTLGSMKAVNQTAVTLAGTLGDTSTVKRIGLPSTGGTTERTNDNLTPTAVSDLSGQETGALGQFFFERMWAIPARIELGNIISSVTRTVEIYSSYREEDRTLTAAAADAGPGVSLSGVPSLPNVISPQSGLEVDVLVLTTGPPSIDGTLDFTLDTGDVSVIITGSRVIMFPYEPETPIREVLEFATDILQAVDGKEQRVSIRKHPRQRFDMGYRLEEGQDRRTFHMILAGAQAATFGIPVWFEARRLGADVTSGSLTVTVDTSYGDFRTDGLAILWSSPTHFEALEIDSFDGSSITFSSALSQDFDAAETLVMPLRVAVADSRASGGKYIKNMDEYRLRFVVNEEGADLADTSAWDSHDSKVMLDDPNWVGSSQRIADNIATRLTILDNETSPVAQFTDWPIAQYQSTKGFIANTPQELWNVRQLVHALRGSQVSFYLPTFYADLVATSDLGSGSDQMQIENIGFADFIDGQEPLGAIWVKKTDGSVVTRNITASETIDSSTERLTLDSVWGTTITLAEIDRIAFLRLVRIADDQVRFEHLRPGEARINMGVLGVQQ